MFQVLFWQSIQISIHALLAESDQLQGFLLAQGHNFYPRSPCGERRVTVLGIQHRVGISIHALLAESDNSVTFPIWVVLHFYPRSPCGERHQARGLGTRPAAFLSTLSLRRATSHCQSGFHCVGFLSTLSLRRATLVDLVSIVTNKDFYPRSPCGERPAL